MRSSAIRPEEEALRTQLDAIEEELMRGGAGRGKMNELWGVVGQLAALRQAGQAPGMHGGPGQEVEWRVVDPEGLETIARVRLFLRRRFLVAFACSCAARDADFIRATAGSCASYQAIAT